MFIITCVYFFVLWIVTDMTFLAFYPSSYESEYIPPVDGHPHLLRRHRHRRGSRNVEYFSNSGFVGQQQQHLHPSLRSKYSLP